MHINGCFRFKNFSYKTWNKKRWQSSQNLDLNSTCELTRHSLTSLTVDSGHCFSTCNNIFTGRNEVVAKVMFLYVCVILFTRGCSGQNPPVKENPPWDQADPPGTRQTLPPEPGRHPPRTRQTTPPLGPGRQHPPWDQADTPTPPPPCREEDCSIRSMSGRYASYWNAFFSFNSLLRSTDARLLSILHRFQYRAYFFFHFFHFVFGRMSSYSWMTW